MNGYLDVIRNAIYFFPFVALLFTVPYILHQYHKYGAIYYIRVLIVYSFILYLITAYFLVILPLPSFEEVAHLTTERMQLIPFSFIGDFIRETSFQIQNVSTYLRALAEPCVYVVVYNIFLTIPFGVYLRYYFQCSLKKCVWYTFLLSLFFELTQLTGLYFIYPRGYRLFDVDDLILNTFGGLCGVILANVSSSLLPSREKLDETSYQLGKKVSFLRRITCFCLDCFLFILAFAIFSIFIQSKYLFLGTMLFYYVVIPFVMQGSTVAQKFLNLKLASTSSEKLSLYQIFLHQGLFFFLYVFLPFFAIRDGSILFVRFAISSTFVAYFYLFGFLGYSLICFASFVLIIAKKKMFYEKFSKTELVSTVIAK